MLTPIPKSRVVRVVAGGVWIAESVTRFKLMGCQVWVQWLSHRRVWNWETDKSVPGSAPYFRSRDRAMADALLAVNEVLEERRDRR